MALGDRAGTERGLEKAKQYGKSEFAALLHELQLWENGLAPSAKENLGCNPYSTLFELTYFRSDKGTSGTDNGSSRTICIERMAKRNETNG